MCGRTVDIQSTTAGSRGGKKKEDRKKKPQLQNIMVCFTSGHVRRLYEKRPSILKVFFLLILEMEELLHLK